MADLGREEPQKSILKNLIVNLRTNDTLVSEYMMNRFQGCEELKNLAGQFSRENFKFDSDEDAVNLQQILVSVLKNAVFNYYVLGKDDSSVKKTYLRKLDIIRLGAEK